MENLMSIEVYTGKVESEIKSLNFEHSKLLADVFVATDTTQTGSIEKFELSNLLEKCNIKISKKRCRELSISLSTRLHGEICLDELVALILSLQEKFKIR